MDEPDENLLVDDMCDPCSLTSKSVEATRYCIECEENLCEDCTNTHASRKATKQHKPVSLQEKREMTSTKCSLCDADALKFCDDCEEMLCSKCIEEHLKRKATKNHVPVALSELLKCSSDSADKESSQASKPEKDQKNTKEEENINNDVPGKPSSSQTYADCIVLVWDKPSRFDKKTDYFQVCYKELGNLKWSFFPGEHDRANVRVTGLKTSTKYIFRVRVVHLDGEGPYSEESNVLETYASAGEDIVKFSVAHNPGGQLPLKYQVPLTEIPNSRNRKNKTRKFDVGKAPERRIITKERTIMLVGATETGKSTLVDGIINYTLGVNWTDPFRFTVIDLEDDEKTRQKHQALSQTEWITVYVIHPENGGRLNYQLNIIDTPGFGDTRGLERDQEIVEQIRALFFASGDKGVACIDGICFLIKSPDERLTAVQSYIFQQILALFGKDVEQNICSLITFADGLDPPVLAALRESNLPFGKHFTFNNSGLFAGNVNLQSTSLSPMFWDMGLKSFDAFFTHLDKMETKSLTLTKNVLVERKRLENTVQNLQPQVDIGLAKLNQLNEEIRIISQLQIYANSNKDFEYEVEEIEQKRHELPKGKHTTNCLHCNYTCHKNCSNANDDQKQRCAAMDKNGNCTQCPDKCHWKQHANTPYIFEYVSVKKKKTYIEKLAKYQAAEGKVLSHGQVIQKMIDELIELQDGIEYLMLTVKQCNERLADIALRPNPLSMTEHIDLMINAEQLEKKAGYLKRIKMLEEMKIGASITTRAANLFKQIGEQS